DMYQAGLVSFGAAFTYNLDEYAGLKPENPLSYHSYMKEHLFDAVDLLPERTHLPNGMAPDLQAECARYDAALAKHGRLDLQLLGLGQNGHRGFNEPAETLTSGTHVADLTEETRQANARYFADESEVPRQALTMGIGSIMKAKLVLLVVKGADKAEIVRRAL